MSIQTVRQLYAAGLSKGAIDQLVALDSDATAAQAAADAAAVDAAAAQAAAAAAESAAKVYAEDVGYTWHTDTAGVWPAGNPTFDLTVTFTGDGLTTSPTTHTVRGTLTSSTGLVSIADLSETGDATVEVITLSSPASDGKAVITHTASGAVGKATFGTQDNSAAGGNPGK